MCNTRLSFIIMPIVALLLLIFPFSIIPLIAYNLAIPCIYLLISWHVSLLICELLQANKNSSGKTVLITGCDSGIGLATAIQLYESGFNVIATCLDLEGAGKEELVKKCQGSNHLNVIKLNVMWSEEELIKVRDEVKSILDNNGSSLWGLVNNAGVTSIAPLEWGDSKQAVEDIISINLVGLIKMVRVFMPLIRSSKGRIVNIASISGKLSLPFTPTYSASKAAVLSISNCIRSNVSRWNVKVSSIIPYAHQSNMTLLDETRQMINRLWNNSSDNVKQAYGEAYKDRFIAFFTNMIQNTSSSTNVAKAVQKCLIAQDPPAEMVCCPLQIKIALFLAKIFPQEWIDYVYQYMDNKLITPK